MSLIIYLTFFQIENMKFKDKRLKIMNEILNGIKVSALIHVIHVQVTIAVKSPLFLHLCKRGRLVEVDDAKWDLP